MFKVFCLYQLLQDQRFCCRQYLPRLEGLFLSPRVGAWFITFSNTTISFNAPVSRVCHASAYENTVSKNWFSDVARYHAEAIIGSSIQALEAEAMYQVLDVHFRRCSTVFQLQITFRLLVEDCHFQTPTLHFRCASMRVLFIGGWILALEWRVVMCIPSCIWQLTCFGLVVMGSVLRMSAPRGSLIFLTKVALGKGMEIDQRGA